MISYLFPGQGSQARGMGGTLFEEFPQQTEIADRILGYSIKELCLEDSERRLNNTRYTQPAIYVVNALSYLKKLGQSELIPDFVAGHSLGEYNALQAAGAISFEDGLKLVKKRGELMARAGQGAMAAILNMPEAVIRQCLERSGLRGIDIANYNGPSQIVVSGLPDDIGLAQTVIEQAGADFIPLNTSGAFHSRYMEPVKAEFADYLRQFEFASLQIPVISNIHARPYRDDEIDKNLADQITHSVKWQQSMEYLLDRGVEKFEEIGNGEVLTKMMTYIKSGYSADGNNQRSQESNRETNKGDPEAAKAKLLETLQKRIEEWNDNHAVGTKVKVAGIQQELQTRSDAMLLMGQKAVVYMKGFKGYFALEEVSAARVVG